MKYSVFTVGVPNYTPEEALIKLKENGYDAVEWRVTNISTDPKVLEEEPSFWGNNKCTIDQKTILSQTDELKALCQKYGIEIAALGTYLNSNSELSDIDDMLKAAKQLGCPQIRVSPENYTGEENYNAVFERVVDRYREIEHIAKKHNVKVNIEMHHGSITSSASAAYRLVSHFDKDFIGVIYDTGNMVYEGFENYKMGLELLGDYVAHVHIKNAKWVESTNENGEKQYLPSWGTFRDGFVDFKKFFEALKSVGYNKYISFEDFSLEEESDVKLRDNIAYIKSLVEV